MRFEVGNDDDGVMKLFSWVERERIEKKVFVEGVMMIRRVGRMMMISSFGRLSRKGWKKGTMKRMK